MKPFEELTERGQIRRLRRLAQAALPQYGQGDAQLTFIAYSENAVFRLESPRGRDTPRERYSLRVHRPGHQTEASLDSELAWMAALRQDKGLPVPEPRPSLEWAVYRQALLGGYAGARPLPKAQLARLDLFMAARHVSEMLWGIDQAQSKPGFRQELDEWLEWAALHVNLYLENKEAL